MEIQMEEVELRELRKDLDEKFKPIFDRHEEEGLPIVDLRHEMENEGLLEHIPRRRMASLFSHSLYEGDKHITYREFIEMMTQDLTKEERKPFKRVMRAAIADIIPRRQREEFLAEYTCCPRPPLFIPLISLAEMIVFFLYASDMSDKGIEVTSTEGVAMYSPLVYSPSKRHEVWRFLTYTLMHQGYLHLMFSMIFLVFFGLPLEIVHNKYRVGLVYLLGTIAGSLAHSVMDTRVGLAGASGGVYALLGAHVGAIFSNWKQMNYKCIDPGEVDNDIWCGCCQIFLSASARLTFLILLVIPDTILAIHRRVTAPEEFKVGATAHFGGFLAGLLLGIVVLKSFRELKQENTLRWITLAIYLAIVAFACIFNALYSGYPETEW